MSQTTLPKSSNKRRAPDKRRPNGVSDATVHLKRRRRRSVRSLVLRILITLLVLAILVGGGWVVGFSNVLATERVTITGTSVLTEEKVDQTSAVSYGQPMIRQDLDGVTARLQTLKPVESVRVERSWPHTITIAVTERTPLYAAGTDGGYLIVDRHGVSFQVVDKPPKGMMTADVDPAADQRLLADVGVVVAALPPQVTRRVDTVKAGGPDTIELVLKNGSRVVWGSAEQSDLKAQVTKALLKEKADVYDVSAPAYPTTR